MIVHHFIESIYRNSKGWRRSFISKYRQKWTMGAGGRGEPRWPESKSSAWIGGRCVLVKVSKKGEGIGERGEREGRKMKNSRALLRRAWLDGVGIGLRFTGKVGNPRYSFLLRGYWVSWDRWWWWALRSMKWKVHVIDRIPCVFRYRFRYINSVWPFGIVRLVLLLFSSPFLIFVRCRKGNIGIFSFLVRKICWLNFNLKIRRAILIFRTRILI